MHVPCRSPVWDSRLHWLSRLFCFFGGEIAISNKDPNGWLSSTVVWCIKVQLSQTQTLLRKRPKQKYKKEYEDEDYEEEEGDPLWEDSSYPEEDYDYVGDDTKVELGRFLNGEWQHGFQMATANFLDCRPLA